MTSVEEIHSVVINNVETSYDWFSVPTALRHCLFWQLNLTDTMDTISVDGIVNSFVQYSITEAVGNSLRCKGPSIATQLNSTSS